MTPDLKGGFYIKIGLKHQVLKLQTVSIVSNKISVICGKQIYYPQHSVDSVIGILSIC